MPWLTVSKKIRKLGRFHVKFDESIAMVLFNAPKTLVLGGWLSRGDGSQELSCDFDGDHPQMRRLVLKVRISAGTSERASFVLLLKQPGQRQMHRIYALDLNGTPHSNPRKTNDVDSLRRFQPGESHEHHFEDRIHDGPVDGFARPVHLSPPNFFEAASYVCAKISVETPPDIPPPPAQGILV